VQARTRWSPLAVLGTWVMFAVVLSGATAWGLTGNGVEANVSLDLTNDAGNQALFSAEPGLAPGEARVACLSVGASGAGPDDEVRFLVRDLTGTLAPELQLDVYMGSGAGYPDCSAFVGDRVYHGTLNGLAALNDQGIDSGWRPGHSSRRSFKFVVTLSEAAVGAGTWAGATFVWRLVSDSPEPTPTGAPSSEPTSGPEPTPTGASSSEPTSGPTPTNVPTAAASAGATSRPAVPIPLSPADATPSSTTTGAGPGQGPGSGSGSASGSGSVSGPDLTLTRTLPIQLARTIIGLSGKPQFTLIPVLLTMLFMLAQHGIDARDPKLAHASRTRRDLTVSFPDNSSEAA
jgi:hypothetical protein